MSGSRELVYLYWFLLLSLLIASIKSVVVLPSSLDCEGDDDTKPLDAKGSSLQSILNDVVSDTVLILEPGCHRLTEFTPVFNKTNITLIGGGNSSYDTNITCTDGIGLTFIDVRGLQLQKLAISNCGLSYTNLNETIQTIIYFVSDFRIFYLPIVVPVGVVIAHSVNVTLHEVYVGDTNGIGVLAVNVMGEFVITSSVFYGNYRPVCYYFDINDGRAHGIGGGLIINYHETELKVDRSSLTIYDSKFLYNSHCGTSTLSEFFYSYTQSLFHSFTQYEVGGGGGLSLFFVQQTYRVIVNIDSCLFLNNTASVGGAIYIALFVGVSNNTVNISDSVFHKNGLDLTVDSNNEIFNTRGQGISIGKDIAFPLSRKLPLPNGANVFTIKNSTFTENIAVSAPAFLLYSRYIAISSTFEQDQILFENCHFEANKGYRGGVSYLYEAKHSGVQLGIKTTFKSCVFKSNVILTHIQRSSSSGIIELDAISVAFAGNSMFINNTGTPIRAASSVVDVYDYICFSNNTGAFGGAIEFSYSSFLVVHNNSLVTISQNTAYVYGGAFYFSSIDSHINMNYYDCFLFFDVLDLSCQRYDTCPNVKDLNITIRFIKNQAPIGNAVYGSTLETCSWIAPLRQRYSNMTGSSAYEFLENLGVFLFDPPIDNDTLATPAYILQVEVPSDVFIMPGENLNLSVTAIDRFNQTTPNAITSSVIDHDVLGQYKSYLDGDTGYSFVNRRNTTSIPVSVRTQIQPKGDMDVQIAIFSVSSDAETSLTVKIQDCYLGFEFNTNSTSLYKSCQCSQRVLQYNFIQCNAETATLGVPNGFWLGQVDRERQLTSHSCLFDFCKVGFKNIANGNFDIQCKEGFHRTGVLCGQCEENLSIVFGTNECKKCSNTGLTLIIFFIFGGFSVIYTIGRIGITVAHGFFNSIIFYCNVIAPYQQYLLMSSNTYYIMILISSINLGFGFPSCFYDGMTTLHRTYLYFAFPMYLWLLLGLYTYLARFEFMKRKWLKENGASVFASVMLLSYTATLQTCVFSLSVTNLNGAIHPWRWALDPSVVYFSKEHAPLACLSIVIILVYIIPAPIFILFPAFTLRTRLGTKFIPIYDAFWAPFRAKFQFWVGLRLFLRIIPFILSAYVTYPLNMILLGVFTVVFLFAHIILKPFKGKAQNILDVYLQLNILLLVMGNLYFSDRIENLRVKANVITLETVYVAVMVFLAYIAFALVCFYHIANSYPFIQKCLKKIPITIKWNKSMRQKENTETLVLINKPDNENTDLPSTVNYSELREPLLESGELSLSAQRQ